VVAGLPAVPYSEGGCGADDSPWDAVLVLRARVRVGVLASAGRDRLPDVRRGDGLVVQPEVGRLPCLSDAAPPADTRREPAGLRTWR
jgi:hypothetical protein